MFITTRHRPVKFCTVKRVLDNIPDLTVVKCVYDRVFLLCSKMARKILSQSCQMAKKNLPYCCPHLFFDKQLGFRMQRSVPNDYLNLFPDNCAQSVVPARIKHFLPTTPGRTKSSPDQEHSRKSIFVSQLAMFNM